MAKKGRISTKRLQNGVIRPKNGGTEVRFWGYKGQFKRNDMVEFETFSHKELQGLLGESAEYPIAKSINGRALPKGHLKKRFVKG